MNLWRDAFVFKRHTKHREEARDRTMDSKGDTERQAILRDKTIREKQRAKEESFLSRILSILKPEMSLCDIGCGTGHIIRELATNSENAFLVGLDISPAMLRVASDNIGNLLNVALLRGDGYELPFSDGALDIMIARLAEYSPQEVYRALRGEGCFIEYGLGPEADKEIFEFFLDRIEEDNFFIPKSPEEWRDEACRELRDAGFVVTGLEDYKRKDYYHNEEEVMDLIEMVPLVRDFDRKKDRKTVLELAEKHRVERGIGITWHYCIIEGKKPKEEG